MTKLDEITSTDPQSEASVVAQLTRLADTNMPVGFIAAPDGRRFVARRVDYALDTITLPNAADVLMPKIITQAPTFQTAESLIGYINRFKNDNSVTFADVNGNRLQSVIDYHAAPSGNVVQPQDKPASEGAVDSRGAARLGTHVATLDLPFSEEWKRWTGQNEKLISHTAFASFLEENAIDVIVPTGAELLELCRDLQVIEGVKFSSSIRMGDTAQVSYQKDNDATSKNNMSLPVQFMIHLPVYFGEPSVDVTCFTRRSISDGKLMLGYKMIRAEQIKQDDFHRVVNEVAAATEITTLYGKRA